MASLCLTIDPTPHLRTKKSEDTQRSTHHRHHYNEQVCGGEMGEEEKRNDLCMMKRGGTGDERVVTNSLMGVGWAAT